MNTIIQKIDWNKYVDHIYSVTCTKDIPQIEILQKELDRVDILNSGIYTNFINVDSPFYKLIYNNVEKVDDYNPYNNQVKLTYAIYYLLRLSYELRYERIIIMEDDIKFLKDKNNIIKVLNHIDKVPKDFDIIACNIERCMINYYDFEKNNSSEFINNVYYQYHNPEAFTNYLSCSTINIYSRNGMKKLIEFFEKIYCVIDRYNIFMINSNINVYSIYPWLGIQQRYAFDLSDLPEVIDNYNLDNITDDEIFQYINKLSKPVGVTDDGISIYCHPMGNLKYFINKLLNIVKDKTNPIYKRCLEFYNNLN